MTVDTNGLPSEVSEALAPLFEKLQSDPTNPDHLCLQQMLGKLTASFAEFARRKGEAQKVVDWLEAEYDSIARDYVDTLSNGEQELVTNYYKLLVLAYQKGIYISPVKVGLAPLPEKHIAFFETIQEKATEKFSDDKGALYEVGCIGSFIERIRNSQ